jgi:gamma-glutamyltranspeptidase
MDGPALPLPPPAVLADNVVATSQPLATQAGIAMLARGGNAVDAALATAMALTVVEPCSNGIGSDLFAIVWDGRELTGLNASGRAPAAWSRERFASHSQMPQRGIETVTIPGAVSGWVGAVEALRQAAVRRSVRAGDPARAGRVPGIARHRARSGSLQYR